jgi:hypothetical protein
LDAYNAAACYLDAFRREVHHFVCSSYEIEDLSRGSADESLRQAALSRTRQGGLDRCVHEHDRRGGRHQPHICLNLLGIDFRAPCKQIHGAMHEAFVDDHPFPLVDAAPGIEQLGADAHDEANDDPAVPPRNRRGE